MINTKTIKYGDTFALKIDHCNNTYYNGKYLILNYIKDEYHQKLNGYVFRVKIVDSIDGVDKKFLDKFQYIITRVTNVVHSSNILDELKKENIKLADQYNYLYQYQVQVFNKRLLKDLVYLGNFKLEFPKNEYIPWTPYNIDGYYWHQLVNEMVYDYEQYNLQKANLFKLKVAKEWYEQELEIKKDVIKYFNDNFRK